jgi:outer membrane protein insertion porin family
MNLRFPGILLFSFVLSAATAHGLDRATLKWIRSKPVIDKIIVEGNKHFSSDEIKKHLYSREHNLWRTLNGDRRIRVQRESMTRDSMEVLYMYLREGYLGVRMTEDFEIANADSAALVRVIISEGRQFRYGPKKVTGTFDEKFRGDFEKIASRLTEGDPADPFKVRQAEYDMKTLLANEGHPYGEVTDNLDTTGAGNEAPVTFTITQRPLVHFGQVYILGMSNYPEYVARRELKIKQGAIYRRKDILDSQQRLYESGYFNTLSLTDSLTATDSLQPDFALRVRERKARYVSVQTGAAQSNVRDLLWDSQIGFGKRNFIGSRTIEANAIYSYAIGSQSGLLAHRYQLRFTEPWFLGIRMPLVLTGEARPTVHSATQDYRVRGWLASAETSKKFGREYSSTLGIEYESIVITGVPPADSVLEREQAGLTGRRKLYMTFQRDSRENIFQPDRGSLFDFSAQYVGGFLGGDVSFTKYEASYSTYQVVWPGWISATRFKAGWAEAFGSSTLVPSEDRLYLGGANTIRGVPEHSLGPSEGSNVITLFNQEFRWRTIQVFQVIPVLKNLLRTMPLWQSVFFDMGNGFANWHEVKVSSFAFAYGTGFQIMSPAGPIRVDYGRLIKTKRYAVTHRWHFTILYAF